MASTDFRFQAHPGQTLTVFLTALSGATGTPNSSGYSATESNGFYDITITEALDGQFQWYAEDSNNEVVANGITDLVDDTDMYWGFDPISAQGSEVSASATVSSSDIQAGLDAQGYTTARAGNLDNLDATVSSREAEADAATRQTALIAEHDATQTDIAAIDVTSDVQSGLTAQGYTTARATNLNNLDATVSSRQSESDALTRYNALITEHNDTQTDISGLPSSSAIASAVWDQLTSSITTVGSIGEHILDNLDAAVSSREAETDAATRQSALITEHDATQTDISGITASISSGDIDNIAAAVWDYLTADATTTNSFGTLVKDNLDATISSRQSESDASTRHSALITEHDATQTSLSGLNDLSSSDITSALTSQGYTTARAVYLDRLDVAVSTREAETDAAARQSALITEHDATQSTLSGFDFQADVIAAMTTHGYTSTRAPKLDNLDNLTSAPPSAADIADAVLDEDLTAHQTAGSAGEAIQVGRDQSVISANNTQP